MADSTGVYHTFTDTRIADADGTFLRGTDGKADHHLIKTIQDQHADIFATNQSPQDEVSGGEWPLVDAVAVLAAPRIKKAKNWAEVHPNLARVGLRYNKVGNTGVIEAVQFGNAREDREVAAGAAYSNAALGKLQKKLKQDYEPAPSGFVVRQFVMPRYASGSARRLSGSKGRRGWAAAIGAPRAQGYRRGGPPPRRRGPASADGEKGRRVAVLKSFREEG